MTDAAAQPEQSQDPSAAPISPIDSPASRVTNDLVAASYLPLCDVLTEDADLVLTSLTRARIAAYLLSPSIGVTRVYVDGAERGDARSIVNATGARSPGPEHGGILSDAADKLIDMRPAIGDTNAQFAQLTAGWEVDTVAAVRAAEQQLAADEAQWQADNADSLIQQNIEPDEVEHYIAPTPPPLPRISGPTVRALLVIALGVVVLIFGGVLRFAPNLTLLLGVAGILLGAGMLVMRLRPHPDDDLDDGAVL